MPCNNTTSTSKTCGSDLKSLKTGRAACRAINRKAAGIKIDFGGSSSSVSKAINKLDLGIHQTAIEKAIQSCDSSASQSGTNVLQGASSACIFALKAAGVRGSALDKYLSISNVSQSSTSSARSVCRLNEISKLLSSSTSTVKTAAAQKAINDSKGWASSSSHQASCNDVREDMTSCEYASLNQCCSSEGHQSDQNIIDAGCSHVEGVTQTLTATEVSNCSLGSTQQETGTKSLSATAKTSSSAENTSSNTIGLFGEIGIGMIIAAILGCFCVTVYLYIKHRRAES